MSESFKARWISIAKRALAISTVLTLSAGVAASAATVNVHKKKKLSLDSITINGGFASGDFGQVWIAARGGYFKQQGINSVNLLNTSLSGAQSTTVLLAGSSQFVIAGAASMVEADQTGATIRQVVALDYGGTEELALNAAVAQKFSVPSTATTPAQVKAQLLALKGSHVNIGISTTGSDGYTWGAALLKQNGLTIDQTQGGSADVNLVPLGQVPTAVFAAVQAGKEDGIINTPPNTVFTSPQTYTIPLHVLTAGANWGAMSTIDSFTKAHPDTVQAVLNAMVEANHLAKTHKTHAYALYTSMMQNTLITSPEEIQYLWAGNSTEWVDIVPTRGGYNKLVSLINQAGIASISVPYTTFVSPKFAIQAYKNAGLAVPPSP